MAQINWVDKCWVTTIFLVRDDGCVLLTMNKNLKTWIPIGGHIDPGETPEEAIRREVAEESGFDFEFWPHVKHDDHARQLFPHVVQVEQVPHHNQHINVVFFGKCTRWDDTDATDEDEKIRWFSAEQLHDMKATLIPSVYEGAVTAIKNVHKN